MIKIGLVAAYICSYNSHNGPVAQSGRALPLQGRGLEFENKTRKKFLGFIEESRRVHDFMFIKFQYLISVRLNNVKVLG